MERSTPLRAGGPALRTHPWYGVEAAAAHCTGCQTSLRLHPSSNLVSKPLAAALALTTQRASLLASGRCWGVLILISSSQSCYRPPGAPFFLLRRRKNRGRKTPLRAGAPALRTHPLGGGRGCSRTLYGVPGRLVTASVVRPGEQTACRCACAYDAACGLASGRCWGFSYPNFFHAIGLAPSGGPILSSVAKKESGKKDATKGGGRSPHLWNPPPAYGVGATAAHCTGYQAGL